MTFLIKLLQHHSIQDLFSRLVTMERGTSNSVTKALRVYINSQTRFIGDTEKYKIRVMDMKNNNDIRLRPNHIWVIVIQISDTKGNFVYLSFKSKYGDNHDYTQYSNMTPKGLRNNSVYFTSRFILAQIDTNKELQEYVSDEFKRCNRKRLIAERSTMKEFGYEAEWVKRVKRMRVIRQRVYKRGHHRRLIDEQRKRRQLKRERNDN